MKPILSRSNLSHPFINFNPLQLSLNSHLSTNQNLIFLSPNHISHPTIPITKPLSSKSEKSHQSNPLIRTQEDGIPTDYVKILVKFKSRYNYIRVLEVSRKDDHPLKGSRLLLLDNPAAKILLELYPKIVIHGWEIDPSVIDVGREYFELRKLEKQYPNRLFVYVGNALQSSLKDGFAGFFDDLFSEGSLIPELQDPLTWEKLKKKLRKGGRIMANVRRR
ncbi:unnamed protein product [Amaranthus hypochondriacus]